MLELLKKKLSELLDSLLDPIWHWVLARSWFSRLIIFLTLVSAVFVIAESQRFLETGRWMIALGQVSIFTGRGLPLADIHQAHLKASRSRLIAGLEIDADRLSKQTLDSWAAAQTAVALSGTTRAQKRTLLELVRKMKDPRCSCWKERKDGNLPPHIPASAWGLLAVSRLGDPVTNNELGFLLKMQNDQNGWWGVFPTNDERSASTFATAWAVLALDQLLKSRQLNPHSRLQVEAAVKKGRAWLLGAREDRRARWKDYPNSENGHESLSLSGLAIHALSESKSNDLTDIHQEWVRDLPAPLPIAGKCEQAFVYVQTTTHGRQLDAFCQLIIPWLLVATSDVYLSSSTMERATIRQWIDNLIPESQLSEADTAIEEWKRAELALSIRYALGEF